MWSMRYLNQFRMADVIQISSAIFPIWFSQEKQLWTGFDLDAILHMIQVRWSTSSELGLSVMISFAGFKKHWAQSEIVSLPNLQSLNITTHHP